MASLKVLGLNCGTSIDGIDVAHCRISSEPQSNNVKIEVLSYTEIPVDPSIRSTVLKLCREGSPTTLAEISDLNFALGREFSRAILESGVPLDQVDIIASHGQTLWHNPVGETRSTLQMAEPAVIAKLTQKTVTSGFRVAELAAGRQGAPLAGFFEAGVLTDAKLNRVSQNIGGIGNASVIMSSDRLSEGAQPTYLAFDTGPGNVFIDAAIRIITNGSHHYDKDGEAGTRGEAEIDHEAVEEYISSEPYFSATPPKTTGRELFSDDVAKRLVDTLRTKGKSDDAIVATLTRITAESIARAYQDFVIPNLGEGGNLDEIYICGGGAFNPNILKHLQARFPSSKVMKLDEAPVHLEPSSKEAVLFALLGYLSVFGRTVPIAADAETKDPAVMGVITPGANYHELMSKVVQSQDFGKSGVLGRIIM